TTFWPKLEGFVDELKFVLVAAWVMVWFSPWDSLAASLVTAPVDAVSECVPAATVDTPGGLAVLLSLMAPDRCVPSLNVTVPVAVEGETAAVRTTFWPKVEGFVDELKFVFVDAWVIIKFAPSNFSV